MLDQALHRIEGPLIILAVKRALGGRCSLVSISDSPLTDVIGSDFA